MLGRENGFLRTPLATDVRRSVSQRRRAIARCKDLAASYEGMCRMYDLRVEPRSEDVDAVSVASDATTAACEIPEHDWDHIRYVITP